MKTISILGCGWLGLDLAKYLVLQGFRVKGSTQTPQKIEILEKSGIEPFLISLQNLEINSEKIKSFLSSEIIFINIPPAQKTQTADSFLEQIKNLIGLLKKYLIKEVIFVSSTSVYAMLNREVTETDIDWQSDHVLVRAEKLFLAETVFRTSILRLSGLIGDDRIPAKYLSGKKNVAGGNDPVNWVYRKDVARIVEQMIMQDKLGEIFNVSCPIQPLRKEVYAKNCADMNMENIEFIDNYSVEGFKKINSDKMISALNYRFLYPDPMGFPYVKK